MIMPRFFRWPPLWLLLVVVIWFPASAFAQGEGEGEAALDVQAALEARGYRVLEVGYAADGQGRIDRTTVYVVMEAAEPQLDTDTTIRQVVFGFGALRDVYTEAEVLIVALQVNRYLLLYPTTGQNFDDWHNELIGFYEFWNPIRSALRILDTETGRYVAEKDFTSKDFSNKDFGGGGSPPPQDNTPLGDENILLQPSTFFLPADGETVGLAVARLSDRQGRPLANKEVQFSFVATGRDPQEIGSVATNRQSGIAIRPFTSSEPLGEVLLRVTTGSQNASVPILIDRAPTTEDALQAILAEAYALDDYSFEGVAHFAGRDVTGEEYDIARIASVMEEQSFNRRVANQVLRSFGTMYTLFPSATQLEHFLIWVDPQGAYYYFVHSLPVTALQEWLNGEITAEVLLTRTEVAILDEDLNFVGDKNFVTKNFAPPESGRTVDVPRTVTATITNEAWGEQLNIGIFRVPLGASADGFVLEELTGNATGFELFDNGAMDAPLVSWQEGEDETPLRSLRLSEGQYLLSVFGSAPAGVTLSYTEHQTR